MASVKTNFAYNLLLTVSGYIFPLITYPYVSRVLGVQNIGICNFADSIIDYFVLFSMLGIASYGVREIARVRNDKEKLDTVFSNLVTFNLITTILAIIVLIVITFTVPKLIDYKPFLLVGIGKLIFGLFQIEWLFTGLQEFRYVTLRSLFVRSLYVLLIFIFVRNQDDTLVYFCLTVPTGFLNASLNWMYSRKFVRYNIKNLNLKLFIIPIFSFGYYRILTSMHTTFNTVFLGFSTNDIEVGYFTTATKLYYIILSVFSALTSVMIPRVSELLHKGNIKELQWISEQTLSVVWTFSIPVIYFCQFYAADVIWIISGPGYEGAITPFRIVIFLLLIIGSEQIIIQQFLMASTKNKPILIVSSIGAFMGVLFNFLITPSLGAKGSAIVWGISEVTVLFVGIGFVKKIIGIEVRWSELFNEVLWSLLYLVPLFVVFCIHLNMGYRIGISIIGTVIIFFAINFWLHKNQQVIEIVGSIWNKMHLHNK